MRGLGLGFTNPSETGGVLDVFGLRWCYVWILCVSGRSRYLYIVLGGYLCISDAHSVQSCCTVSISASTVYLSVSDIANPYLCARGCRTWICLDIARFYEE